MTPDAPRWAVDDPLRPVEVLIVRLANGWPLWQAVPEGMAYDVARRAAELHGWPDDIETTAHHADLIYRRHGIDVPPPLPPPDPTAPGDTMTEPPTEPTGIPLDADQEGQSQPAAEVTGFTIGVTIPSDLDADVDLADIREHERELRRARDRVDALAEFEREQRTPRDDRVSEAAEQERRRIAADPGVDQLAEEYRAKHEERGHEQVPGFADAIERANRAARSSDAGSFLAELGRRTSATLDAAGIARPWPRTVRPRPPIRGRAADRVIIDEASRLPSPDAVTYGTDGNGLTWTVERRPGPDPRFPVRPDNRFYRLAEDRDDAIVEHFGPATVDTRLVDDPRPDAMPWDEVTVAEADPVPETTATQQDTDDDDPWNQDQRARVLALLEARALSPGGLPSDLILLADFIITGRSS